MEESSSAAPSQPKPVVVRVKRKPSQSPLDAFCKLSSSFCFFFLGFIWGIVCLKFCMWVFQCNVGLEINERPLKRSLLDLGKLTISGSAQKGMLLLVKFVLQII